MSQPREWFRSFWNDSPPSNVDDEENAESTPLVVLPWRIGIFLLTSTIVQNLSYIMATYLSSNSITWTSAEFSQFYSLCYTMIYLGPIFGLGVDLVRVFRERYRPVIIIACLINAILCFVSFATKNIEKNYKSALMLTWLMEVVTMFMYMPMNAVVINYGNRALESPWETSARIGGLMAQSMVWRSAGTLIQTIFVQLSQGSKTNPAINNRYMVLIAGIGSCVLVFQVLLLTKRSYYLDYRRISLKTSTPVRFYTSFLTAKNNLFSSKKESSGGRFMFMLCFTFIYFMLPDALYNTRYSFEYQFTSTFSTGLSQANSILSQIGAVVGALAYALWMYFAQRYKTAHNMWYRAHPFVICLAGCCAWAFGTFFHFIGEMGSTNESFNYKVFIPIESFVVAALLRFAFMPTLSLIAMHAPRDYETTAFELYSVATTGGGVVSSATTTYFKSDLGATPTSGYWKLLLLFIVFRFIPMLIAVTLPKFREDEVLDTVNEREVQMTEPTAPLDTIELQQSHEAKEL